MRLGHFPVLTFLAFLEKRKENHQKNKDFLSLPNPQKSLEKKGKTLKKKGIPRRGKKQGIPKKQGKEGQGCAQKDAAFCVCVSKLAKGEDGGVERRKAHGATPIRHLPSLVGASCRGATRVNWSKLEYTRGGRFGDFYRRLKVTSTERQKRSQNLAPVLVIISGNSLAAPPARQHQ